MTDEHADFLLAIPAYREHRRLPNFLSELIQTLREAPFSTLIRIVDDGSPEDENTLLLKEINTGVYGSCTVHSPLLLPGNQGKGAAILAGWRAEPAGRWLAFVDADGAISAIEVRRVLGMVFEEKNKDLCFFGSRIRKLGRRVKRRVFRHVVGRFFATLVGTFIESHVYDSQCGFKILPRPWFLKVDAQLEETGLCFDIELLLALKQAGAKVIEVPVDWEDKAGGSVGVFRHGLAMLPPLWRLRRRFPPST